MLAFVGNKDSKPVMVDASEVDATAYSLSVTVPSPALDESNPVGLQHCLARVVTEQKMNIQQTETEQLPNTPSVTRVSFKDSVSTGSDASESGELAELSQSGQESSAITLQVLFQGNLLSKHQYLAPGRILIYFVYI